MTFLLLGLLVDSAGDNMPYKQAKTATYKLKAHQNDANTSLAHGTGDSEKTRMRTSPIGNTKMKQNIKRKAG